jgi:predicted exporter
MRRLLALLWLLLVFVAAGYLGWRIEHGLAFQTDLLALLPREEQNPALQKANDTVARALSQKLVFLVGHPDRAQARAVAAELSRRLSVSGLAELTTGALGKDQMRQMGELYFPYRQGLLSDGDRQRLRDGKGGEVALRALSQVFGFVGTTDARILRGDPFLLMQSFFISLPLPQTHLNVDDGMLSLNDGGVTWVMVSGRLKGEPYALDIQRRLTTSLDLDGLARATPQIKVLKLGAVFFAEAGARQAMDETSLFGLLSILGTIAVVLVAYRALSPLWLSLLVIGTGIGTALAASLWLFGELHVGALLFGVSLIGVAVDYSLQYCTEIFAAPASPIERLRRVFAGIGIGTATTVIGYLTLFLAPFPGLHQIAAFSAVGLVASWLTVVLWLPALDRARHPIHGATMLAWAATFMSFWQGNRRRNALLAILALLGLAGAYRFHADDDVRRMQSLSPQLVAEQETIQRLIGSTGGSQFFLVDSPDDETALRREEALAERLRPLVISKALGGFQAPAEYVPSVARQTENRGLVAERLTPLMAQQMQQLGLAEAPPAADPGQPPLTLAQALRSGGPLGFLSALVLEPGLHVVSLDAVVRLAEVAAAAEDLEGVRFVDPAGQFSTLLTKYRQRALALLVVSAVLMAPILIWRYGLKGGAKVLLPPLLAVLLAPALRALLGGAFSFFDAMALVLVLSIGVDYAVFCAETTIERKAVTMLAVVLAASTALLSFGLLALSGVHAVRSFGATMLLGILLAFLLAPMARRKE